MIRAARQAASAVEVTADTRLSSVWHSGWEIKVTSCSVNTSGRHSVGGSAGAGLWKMSTSSPFAAPVSGDAEAVPIRAEELIDPRVIQCIGREVAQCEPAAIVARQQSLQQEFAVAPDAIGYSQHFADVVADSEGFRSAAPVMLAAPMTRVHPVHLEGAAEIFVLDSGGS